MAMSSRVRPFSKPFQLATRLSRLSVRPCRRRAGAGAPARRERFHHARCGARDAPAFFEQRRTFALRRIGAEAASAAMAVSDWPIGRATRGQGGALFVLSSMSFRVDAFATSVTCGFCASVLKPTEIAESSTRSNLGQAGGEIVRRKLREPGANDGLADGTRGAASTAASPAKANAMTDEGGSPRAALADLRRGIEGAIATPLGSPATRSGIEVGSPG